MLSETGLSTDRPSSSFSATLKRMAHRAIDVANFHNQRFSSAWSLMEIEYEARKSRNRLRFLGDYLQASDYPDVAGKYKDLPEYEYMRVLKERAANYYKDPDHVGKILKAAEFGETKKRLNEARTGKVKKRESSGRDAYEHPVEVAIAAMDHLYDEFKVLLDPDAIAAILLHDSMEDDNVHYVDIAEQFGVRVADIVFRMTKIKGEQFENMDPLEAEALTVERLLKCMQYDPNGEMPPDLVVLVAKLFDREVNSRTFREMKDKHNDAGEVTETAADRQKRKGDETLNIYYTLADYFRMWKLRDLMGDRAFECADPEAYAIAKELQLNNDVDLSLLGEQLDKIIDRHAAKIPYIRAKQDKHIRKIRKSGALNHFVPRIADIRLPSAYEIHLRMTEEGMESEEACRPTIYIDAQNPSQRGKFIETLLRFNPYSGQVNFDIAQEEAKIDPSQDQLTVSNFKLTPDHQVTIVLRNVQSGWVTNMPLALRVQFPPTADSVMAEQITYAQFSSHFTDHIGSGVVDRIDVFLDEIRKKDLTYVYVVNDYTPKEINYAERVLLKDGATALDYLCRKFTLDEIETFSEIYIFDPLTGAKKLINDRLGDVLPRGCYVLLSKNGIQTFHYKPNPRDLFCQKTNLAMEFILRRMTEHYQKSEEYKKEVGLALIERGKDVFWESLVEESENTNISSTHHYVDELFEFYSATFGDRFNSMVQGLALSYVDWERDLLLKDLRTFVAQRSINLAMFPGSQRSYTAELSDYRLFALKEYVEHFKGVMKFIKTVSANGALEVNLDGYIAIPNPGDMNDIHAELNRYVSL